MPGSGQPVVNESGNEDPERKGGVPATISVNGNQVFAPNCLTLALRHLRAPAGQVRLGLVAAFSGVISGTVILQCTIFASKRQS
jgi:hypothetical protein